MRMLAHRPIFGSGLSGFASAINPYRNGYAELQIYPHNILLNFWAETGILGLVAFGWLMVKTFIATLAGWIHGSSGWRPYQLGVLLFVGWGLVNLVVSVVLVRGYRPGRWFGFLTTGIDLLVATSILYFSGGYGAPTDFSLLFFLLIIASAVRLGLPGALATAIVVSLLYVVIGGLTSFASVSPPPGFVIGRVFLFLLVALVAGLLVADIRSRLDRALRPAIERATQLDETRRREALEKERVERLEEIDKVRSDFISMVAHELQTPLASIKTQSETLLTQQHRLDQETRSALVDGIHRSAASLTDLVQDFAAVNRIENNQF